jgi:serine/threonine protein kinase
MKHPNVVRVLGLCIDGQEVNIVSELCHSDLNAILHGGMRGGKWQDKVSLSAKERISIMIQISRGMLYLHKKERLIHRDLKPVMSSEKDSRLCNWNFGISKVWEKERILEFGRRIHYTFILLFLFPPSFRLRKIMTAGQVGKELWFMAHEMIRE